MANPIPDAKLRELIALGEKADPEPTRMVHPLKTWPEFFQHIITGTKTFELRKNDRGFMPGDTLLLREYDPLREAYTGRDVEALVTYMVGGGEFGLPPSMCVMSIRTASANLAVPLAEEVMRLRAALSRIFEAHTRTDLSSDPAYEHNAVRKEKEALRAE